MSTRRPLPLRAVVEALEARIAPAAVVALDSDNHLLRFDSATPGMPTGGLTVTGLADGVRLEAIDFRPTTGYMYALGVLDGPNAGDTAVSLYGINLVDGSVYLVGGAPFATGLADGAVWSLDFDPVTVLCWAVSSSGTH